MKLQFVLRSRKKQFFNPLMKSIFSAHVNTPFISWHVTVRPLTSNVWWIYLIRNGWNIPRSPSAPPPSPVLHFLQANKTVCVCPAEPGLWLLLHAPWTLSHIFINWPSLWNMHYLRDVASDDARQLQGVIFMFQALPIWMRTRCHGNKLIGTSLGSLRPVKWVVSSFNRGCVLTQLCVFFFFFGLYLLSNLSALDFPN